MTLYSQIEQNQRRTFFLFFFTVLVILLLGYLFGTYFEDPYLGVLGALVFSVFYTSTAYFFSDQIVLGLSGAHPIEKKDNPRLYRIVENLCIGAGLSMPKIYIMEQPAMNAFATGRDPKHGVVVVTRGLLDKLDSEEVEGVLAHELSHIQNHDIQVAALAAVLAGAVVIISDIFLRSFRFRGSRERDEGVGILILVGFLLAFLSPIFAQLIRLAISRQREFLADSSGALLTRYPEGLARALEKIAADKTPLQGVSGATAHLYIKNPLGESFLEGLFSTHPSIEERIRRLRAA